MKYESTCSCGARLVVEWVQYDTVPFMLIHDWNGDHKDCKPVAQVPKVLSATASSSDIVDPKPCKFCQYFGKTLCIHCGPPAWTCFEDKLQGAYERKAGE